MGMVEVARDALDFICTVQFWRMTVLWTLSLIFSYLKLFSQSFISSASKTYWRCSLSDHGFTEPAMTRPICIVTGATSGLGAEVAYSLSKEGFYVVLVGRSSELLSQSVDDIKSRNTDACLKAFQVDLSSFKSIAKFKSSLQRWLSDSNMHSSVQLLVNNAGILATSHRLTSDGYDQMMATNYLGAFCFTQVLLPLLENSPVPSRVVNVSSFTHQNGRRTKTLFREGVLPDQIATPMHIYMNILNYAFYSFHMSFTDKFAQCRNHVTYLLYPGAVRTNIMREIPPCISQMALTVLNFLGLLQSSEIGASSILDAALCSPEVSGVYFFGGNGRSLNSSALSYDSKLANDLWTTSCDMFQELQLASGKDELLT